MRRITRRMCGGYGLVDGYAIHDLSTVKLVVNTLAAYEETGMTPAEIQNMKDELERYQAIGAPEALEQACVWQKESVGHYITPFVNDPFSLVWLAFKRLYPGKDCRVFYDQHQGDSHDNEYGFTLFPEDGSKPDVFIFAEHNINIQTETLAHELAHVAVGAEDDHGEAWEQAFDDIFKEYNRIGDAIFGVANEAE